MRKIEKKIFSSTYAQTPRVFKHLKSGRSCCFLTRQKNREKNFGGAASNGKYCQSSRRFDTMFYRSAQKCSRPTRFRYSKTSSFHACIKNNIWGIPAQTHVAEIFTIFDFFHVIRYVIRHSKKIPYTKF